MENIGSQEETGATTAEVVAGADNVAVAPSEGVIADIGNEQVARIAHQINKAYCEAMGDTSQVNWEDAPEWQKQSALLGVNLHLNNPGAGPEASHESWMAQKQLDGWIYGEKKDAGLKTHPCMVPFAELAIEQQAKDFIFRAAVHAANAIILPVVEPGTQIIHQHPAPVGTIAVRMKLNREGFTDVTHGTGAWEINETKSIPASIAKKLLSHEDVYEISDEQATAEVAALEAKKPDDDKGQQTYDMINAMEKDALKSYIKTQFNRDVDMRKHKDVSTLRVLATQLYDQYGAAE